jgi:hypothetical protein
MRNSNHKLTYIEMYPEPLSTTEPSPLAIIGGAFAFAALMYLLTVLAFSL